jgi:ABC-type lipoprotein export system ATPase subunit
VLDGKSSRIETEANDWLSAWDRARGSTAAPTSSAGREQRVAVACALIRAALVLGDEPTGNWTAHVRRDRRAAAKSGRVMPVLMVTHDARIAYADRIIFMKTARS